jgi:hypothetical protein
MAHEGGPGNFEQEILPHLDAAYNLARWLTRNEQDAQDAVGSILACLPFSPASVAVMRAPGS